jgi:hypothetical protein
VTADGPSAVTYDGLPISSGGAHSLGRMGLRTAYTRTAAFVDACTVVVAPRRQSFQFQQVPELRRYPELKEHFRRRFGGGADHAVRIDDDQVDDALAFLEEVSPQPQNQWGMAPLWFTTRWDVQILDPDTREPLPGQDPSRYGGAEHAWTVPLGESTVTLMLSNTASLGVQLCLPDLDDERLRTVAQALQASAPFRFSPKQWRRWTRTASGTFRPRKITPLPGGN